MNIALPFVGSVDARAKKTQFLMCTPCGFVHIRGNVLRPFSSLFLNHPPSFPVQEFRITNNEKNAPRDLYKHISTDENVIKGYLPIRFLYYLLRSANFNWDYLVLSDKFSIIDLIFYNAFLSRFRTGRLASDIPSKMLPTDQLDNTGCFLNFVDSDTVCIRIFQLSNTASGLQFDQVLLNRPFNEEEDPMPVIFSFVYSDTIYTESTWQEIITGKEKLMLRTSSHRQTQLKTNYCTRILDLGAIERQFSMQIRADEENHPFLARFYTEIIMDYVISQFPDNYNEFLHAMFQRYIAFSGLSQESASYRMWTNIVMNHFYKLNI